MRINHKEDKILDGALKAFKDNFNMPVDYKIEATQKLFNDKTFVDKVVQVRVLDEEMRFCAEIKTHVHRAMIGQLLKLKEELPHPVLLIADYIGRFMADELKKNEIEFIDTGGNAYINHLPIYVFVKGNNPPEEFKQTPCNQAFTATGLKLIFAFLCNPGLVNKPYRDIYKIADIALGGVGWIIADLKKLGFLVDMGKKGRRLQQKEKLLERWVTAYPEKLRPKLVLERFTGTEKWWQTAELNEKEAQWGGEVAAAKMTKYLKPQDVTIYIDPKYLNNLAGKNKLHKNKDGNVEVLKCFWGKNEENIKTETVHPILVYADLMATADQRNIETAKVIFEKYLGYIRED